MWWMMWRESFTSPYLRSALKVYRALRHVPKPFDIADGGVHAAHGLLAEALVANASPAAARDVRNLLGGGTSTIVDDDVSVDGVVRTSTHVGIVCGVDDVASTITAPPCYRIRPPPRRRRRRRRIYRPCASSAPRRDILEERTSINVRQAAGTFLNVWQRSD